MLGWKEVICDTRLVLRLCVYVSSLFHSRAYRSFNSGCPGVIQLYPELSSSLVTATSIGHGVITHHPIQRPLRQYSIINNLSLQDGTYPPLTMHMIGLLPRIRATPPPQVP